MAFLALLIGGAESVQANIVLDGNFGTGDFSNFTLAGDTNESFVAQNGTGFAAALTTANADGFLSQSLVTVARQAYTGSFLLIGDGATPNNFAASVAGVTLVSLTDVPNTLPSGNTFNFAFVATSTSSLLSFDFRDDPGFLHLTNIVVNPTASAVPEPSAIVCLSMGGLIVMGHLGWKRRKANQVRLATL